MGATTKIVMEIDNIKNKKILFIAFPFFNYEYLIKKELENLGADVDYFPGKFHTEDFHDNPHLLSAFISFICNPKYKRNYTRELYCFIESKNKIYDILFVIQTYPASEELIQKLKIANSQFKSYIYFWDSFSLFKNSSKIKYFDYSFSFDKNDCKRHKKLIHLHGFYPHIENNGNENIIYDWSYIGSVYPMSSYRIDFINKLIKNSKEQNLSFYARLKYYNIEIQNSGFLKLVRKLYQFIFHPKAINFYRKINKYSSMGFLYTDTITLETVMKIQNQSKCVIDINYRNRTGITFQCFPIIARNKKLITTNKSIVHESFYNPNNILVIDEKKPEIDMEFIQKPCIPVDISYLRIDNWLKIIFKHPPPK
jgi:hypothetical protein